MADRHDRPLHENCAPTTGKVDVDHTADCVGFFDRSTERTFCNASPEPVLQTPLPGESSLLSVGELIRKDRILTLGGAASRNRGL